MNFDELHLQIFLFTSTIILYFGPLPSLPSLHLHSATSLKFPSFTFSFSFFFNYHLTLMKMSLKVKSVYSLILKICGQPLCRSDSQIVYPFLSRGWGEGPGFTSEFHITALSKVRWWHQRPCPSPKP